LPNLCLTYPTGLSLTHNIDLLVGKCRVIEKSVMNLIQNRSKQCFIYEIYSLLSTQATGKILPHKFVLHLFICFIR